MPEASEPDQPMPDREEPPAEPKESIADKKEKAKKLIGE